jgi:hypothetical protein
MADVPPGAANTLPVPVRPPFPFERMFYSIGFGVVAFFAIQLIFVLAFAQFVIFAINGHVNDELKGFLLRLVQYLWELLAFVAFVRDEKPFPFAPFPKHV